MYICIHIYIYMYHPSMRPKHWIYVSLTFTHFVINSPKADSSSGIQHLRMIIECVFCLPTFTNIVRR